MPSPIRDAVCTDAFWGEIGPSEHFVQFYGAEPVLLDTLQGFVGGGLQAGEGAIVIATAPHVAALEMRMQRSGIDVAKAIAEDCYLAVGAHETLARFMRDDWPDETLFAATVGPLLERASGDGRKVRAFGEMVALLWESGHFAATVCLERLWHKLCAEQRLALFCAYPRAGFTEGATPSIPEISAAHSRVLPN